MALCDDLNVGNLCSEFVKNHMNHSKDRGWAYRLSRRMDLQAKFHPFTILDKNKAKTFEQSLNMTKMCPSTLR